MTLAAPPPIQPLSVAETTSQPDPHRYRALAPVAPEGPLDPDQVLPGTGPLELEIGFGRGLFLFERAAAHPEVRMLGVEIKRKWAYKVEQRAAALELHNVKVWSGDVRVLLGQLPEGCLTRVFMHFPDPWWKKRHAARRLTGDVLLDAIARVLKPGGELFVQSDVEDRAEAHLAAIREHAAFRPGGQDGVIEANPYDGRSNREVRADEDGLPVYRTLAIKL